MRLLVVGHGCFASGMLSAAEMLCGTRDGARAMDFTPELSPDELGEGIAAELAEGPALVLCDLLGGTPYNQAVLQARGRSDVSVVGGANLAMVLEALLALGECGSAHELARLVVNAAGSAIAVFEDVAEGVSDTMSSSEEL